jgi:WhiB family transcriptional regulator, redox-sensing transcriptional regulator
MTTEWMADGHCATQPPSLFFPSDGAGVEKARKVCATCPMRTQCLEYALVNRVDHGVWGGTSERQRRRILKSRRLAAGSPIPQTAELSTQ